MKKMLLGLLSLVFIINFNLNSTSPIYDVSGNNVSAFKKDIFLEKVFEQNNSLIEQNKLLIEQMIKQSPQKEISKPAPTPQGKKSVLSKICGGTVDTVKFIIDKSDKLVSKRGAITLLLLSAPALGFYHYCINNETLPRLLFEKIPNLAYKGAYTYGTAETKFKDAVIKGKTVALANYAIHNPGTTAIKVVIPVGSFLGKTSLQLFIVLASTILSLLAKA